MELTFYIYMEGGKPDTSSDRDTLGTLYKNVHNDGFTFMRKYAFQLFEYLVGKDDGESLEKVRIKGSDGKQYTIDEFLTKIQKAALK